MKTFLFQINMQVGIFSKIYKRAVPNKLCRQEKKSKINKMCCMIIPHNRVHHFHVDSCSHELIQYVFLKSVLEVVVTDRASTWSHVLMNWSNIFSQLLIADLPLYLSQYVNQFMITSDYIIAKFVTIIFF